MNLCPTLTPVLSASVVFLSVWLSGFRESGAEVDSGADGKKDIADVKPAGAKTADGQSDAGDNLLFRFGAVADCQYCDADSQRRRYRLSAEKLRQCVAEFNKYDLTHLVHLGDFIDRDWKSFDDVLPIMKESKAPVRFVLGNHDFSVGDEFKARVPERLGLKSRYYDFVVGKWRFLVLDTNDLSLYAYASGSDGDLKSKAAYEKWGGNLPNYNGGIGEEQMVWIEKKLTDARDKGETVVLHSHHPVYPFSPSHTAWNARAIVSVLEKHACVAAYINGHNHDGAYGFKKGIHYLTLKGMVDTEETAYAVVDVFPDRIEVNGRGRQDNYALEIARIQQADLNP